MVKFSKTEGVVYVSLILLPLLQLICLGLGTTSLLYAVPPSLFQVRLMENNLAQMCSLLSLGLGCSLIYLNMFCSRSKKRIQKLSFMYIYPCCGCHWPSDITIFCFLR